MPCTENLEILLKNYNISETKQFIFSADTNIINSGVMLLRSSTWMIKFIDEIIAIGPTPNLGMGYENTALAIALAGCNRRSTRVEREECYNRSDFAYLEMKQSGSAISAAQLSNGNQSLLNRVIKRCYSDYVHLLPQRAFNSYEVKNAKFIVHFPNTFSSHRKKLLRKVLKKTSDSKCHCPSQRVKIRK